MERDEPAGDSKDAPGDLPELPRCGVCELAPPDVLDPVVEFYKKDVDRTLLRANLKLSPAERARKLADFANFLAHLRQAGHRLRGASQ